LIELFGRIDGQQFLDAGKSNAFAVQPSEVVGAVHVR
jgi:hypothetical protein